MASRKFKSIHVAHIKPLWHAQLWSSPSPEHEAHSDRPAFQWGPLTGPSDSQDVSAEGDLWATNPWFCKWAPMLWKLAFYFLELQETSWIPFPLHQPLSNLQRLPELSSSPLLPLLFFPSKALQFRKPLHNRRQRVSSPARISVSQWIYTMFPHHHLDANTVW